MKKRYGMFMAFAALLSAASSPAVAVKDSPGNVRMVDRSGTTSISGTERRQFNFRRSGGANDAKRIKTLKLKYGSVHKHFNKKRHGRNLRRAHRRAGK